jgi:hypothetical protein
MCFLAPEHLSCQQRRILAWLDQEERRTCVTVSTEHRALAQAMGVDKGNLNTSLKGLERKGLIRVHRTPGASRGRGPDPSPPACREVVNKVRSALGLEETYDQGQL